MSSSFNKFQPFVANIANGVFNFGSDSLKVALSNTLPTNTNNKLSDITEISYSNCSARAITTTSSTQSGGVYSLILATLVLTASGTVGPFRYVVIYDDTTSNKNLIGWYDYGSNLTLAASQTFTVGFDLSNGILQLQ